MREQTIDSPQSSDTESWEQLFKLTPEGTPKAQRNEALRQYREYVHTQRANFMGYQADEAALDYEADLSWLLNYHINNIGDPFTQGNFTLNSKAIEQQVLDYYAKLWHAEPRNSPKKGDRYWGYLLTMGSTEGNMYGMWNARDYLGGKALMLEPKSTADANEPPRFMWVQAKAPETNPNAFTPVAFFSEDTHYSFTKAVRVLGIKTFYEVGQEKYPGKCPLGGAWPTEVPSVRGESGTSIDGTGEIDIGALTKLADFFAKEGYPILVSLNYGTTFKGAYDPVVAATQAIVQVVKKYPERFEREVEYAPGKKDRRYGFWIHVDGALGAAYMPFLKMAQDSGQFTGDMPVPAFDFGSSEYVFSMAMSGHKWVGAPWPCGLFMTKEKYQLLPPDMPVYIGAPDTTFAGSRNGFSSLVLWDYLAKHSHQDQIRLAIESQRLAKYTEQRLLELATKLGRKLLVARGPLAITVRFLQPNDAIVRKYSLSTEEFQGSKNKYAHVFLMPGMTTDMVDRLIEDLSRPGAFPAPREAAPLAAAAERAAAPLPMENVRQLGVVPNAGRGFK